MGEKRKRLCLAKTTTILTTPKSKKKKKDQKGGAKSWASLGVPLEIGVTASGGREKSKVIAPLTRVKKGLSESNDAAEEARKKKS